MTDEQHPEGTPAPKTTITITDLADVREGDTVTVEFDGGTFIGPVRTGSLGDLVAGGWRFRKGDGMPVVGTRFISATREAPAWPTAPLVWWDGHLWIKNGEYGVYRRDDREDVWNPDHRTDGYSRGTNGGAERFAAEAVPVTVVPTAALDELRTRVQIDTEKVRYAERHELLWQAAHVLIDAMHEEGDR